MQGSPICILCLRDCDSSGCLSSCNHFFCARCVPRLPPANPPSTPPLCPICKRPYRLVSINSTAVQPLLQEPNSLFKILCNQHGHHQQVIQRMRDALRILKEEVKAKDRKYREKSAALDRIIRQQQQRHQQQLQMQMSAPMQPPPYTQRSQQPYTGNRASQPQLGYALLPQHQSTPHVQASTPRDRPCLSPLIHGSGNRGLLGHNGVRAASQTGYNASLAHAARMQLPPSPAPASLPLPAMSQSQAHSGHHSHHPPPNHTEQRAPYREERVAPLGWSATSGILLPTNRSAESSLSKSAAARMGSSGGSHVQAGSVGASSGLLSEALRQTSTRSAFRLSTPLDRTTATPDLLWPR